MTEPRRHSSKPLSESRTALEQHDSCAQLRGCAAMRGGPCRGVAIVRLTRTRPPCRIRECWCRRRESEQRLDLFERQDHGAGRSGDRGRGPLFRIAPCPALRAIGLQARTGPDPDSVVQDNAQQCALTFSLPLPLMNPSFRNLFMKKLTRDRVVPTISASVSCEIFGSTRCGLRSSP